MATAPSQMPDMFRAYPALQGEIPWLPIATLPTPVQNAAEFAARHGIASLHIKRDDQSGAVYGGNKTRKLAFLLAAAQARGARTVITFGAAGSNHCLATALYARELGLDAALLLGPQHNSSHVRENLRIMYESGAQLCYGPWKDTTAAAAALFHALWKRDGAPPYVIPPGGSSPLGALGFVNAAFELGNQVAAGLLPRPDVMYVASGTMGSCVGLTLGLQALGFPTVVMAIRVTKAPYTSLERAQRLFQATTMLLRRSDAVFPALQWNDGAFRIRDAFFGPDYALYTEEGMVAKRAAAEGLDLTLEGVYTGKAFAGLLADAEAGHLHDKQVLFWNTYSGGAPSCNAAPFDYHGLPGGLHHYFEAPTQPLDGDASI